MEVQIVTDIELVLSGQCEVIQDVEGGVVKKASREMKQKERHE